MKKATTITLSLLMMFSLAGNGQYEAAMAKNIPAVFSARSVEELEPIVNALERIGNAEETKWHPFYYAAFGKIRMMQMMADKERQDQYLASALKTVEKGMEVSPSNSELESMRGYVIMMQLTVDPQNRGQQYSGMAFNAFNKAINLDQANPRAVYLLGQMQLGTAQFFGGGDGGSCETFRKALTLLEGDEKQSPFDPDWGRGAIDEALRNCDQ